MYNIETVLTVNLLHYYYNIICAHLRDEFLNKVCNTLKYTYTVELVTSC